MRIPLRAIVPAEAGRVAAGAVEPSGLRVLPARQALEERKKISGKPSAFFAISGYNTHVLQ
jgi:hypothetical protein